MNCRQISAKILTRIFAGALLFAAAVQLHAQTICSNNTGSAWVDGSHQNNANWYTFWSNQSGNCWNNQLTLNGNGQYQANWNLSAGYGNMVVGVGWQTGSLSRSISYNFGTFNPGSNAYLSLYGWSSNGSVDWYDSGRSHHVEYYVLESYGPYNPAWDSSMIPVYWGQPVYVDGVSYHMYLNYKYGPSFYSSGNENFYQFWLIRDNPVSAPTGNRTINFAHVVQTWATYGAMRLNAADGYQVMATEGYGSSGSSNGTVWKNNY